MLNDCDIVIIDFFWRFLPFFVNSKQDFKTIFVLEESQRDAYIKLTKKRKDENDA